LVTINVGLRTLAVNAIRQSMVLICLISASNSWAQTTQIESLRLWHSPDKTRVVFDVSADVKYHIFDLDNPQRIVIDIQNGGLQTNLPKLQDNFHIAGMRSGKPNKSVFRVVLDLKRKLKSNAFVLTPNELYGHRLVVDLLDESVQLSDALGLPDQGSSAAELLSDSTNGQSLSAQDSSAEQLPADQQAEPAPASTVSQATPPQQPVSVAIPSRRDRRQLVVAIDAGHGGEDPGAIGHRGSREKVITLSIAKKLKNVIDSDPKMRAFLVRTGDYYIKLHKRRQMARAKGADLFISIHADAFKHRSANGLSVFALSQRGATSAMASALAAKENASDLIGGVSLANKDEVLAKVLVDLSMTATISDSVNLGGRVLKELGQVGRLHSKRVEQAGFAVLKSPDMPSILVETGFITNPEEERKLRTSSYQNKIANAVYRAVQEFYAQTPYLNNGNYATPQVTANRQTSAIKQTELIRHKVKRGDTLSELAERYGTTMRAIKRDNNLRRNTLWLGETLKIQTTRSKLAKVQQPSSTPRFHTVKRGDSLSKISAKYNVTIAHLKRINGLSKSVVYPGQKLKISTAAASKPKAPTIHTVKRGDTLSEIAERYGASMRSIMRVNKLRSKTVYLGQRLEIPG